MLKPFAAQLMKIHKNMCGLEAVEARERERERERERMREWENEKEKDKKKGWASHLRSHPHPFSWYLSDSCQSLQDGGKRSVTFTLMIPLWQRLRLFASVFGSQWLQGQQAGQGRLLGVAAIILPAHRYLGGDLILVPNDKDPRNGPLFEGRASYLPMFMSRDWDGETFH